MEAEADERADQDDEAMKTLGLLEADDVIREGDLVFVPGSRPVMLEAAAVVMPYWIGRTLGEYEEGRQRFFFHDPLPVFVFRQVR